MEKNTVILSLEQYNYLRDVEKNQREKHSFEIKSWNSNYIIVMSDNEIVEKIVKENQRLFSNANELSNELLDLQRRYNRFKEFSIWDFFRWKKGSKNK
jgi:hypothetical protein